jgi:hypothetical protein
MEVVTYQQLLADVTQMSYRMPRFDLVVGIPRSGMIPATMLALHWNVPITTPKLLPGVLDAGNRLGETGDFKKILVIDDSHFRGTSIAKVKEQLKWIGVEVKYAAVYSSNRNHDLDYCYKYVPQPRLFEWNWLHHDLMSKACFDIDGVLCRPPTSEENDYGPKYDLFLERTEPRYIPALPIMAIITGRLERYREATEAWLLKHGVRYGELIMRQDASTGIIHHKSTHYAKMGALFIEDEIWQAKGISHNTEKPVLCVTDMKLYEREKL